MDLAQKIEELFNSESTTFSKNNIELFIEFKQALNEGRIRIAEKQNNEWIINHWVKQGILLGFRFGKLSNISINDNFVYFDKDTFPLKKIEMNDNVRLVPGGSTIRDGCYVSPGVVCMPPMYINVGAYVDEGTMIDSHALIGSCAQVGKHVHISAAAQIGGVLEPVEAMPVIIEDNVLIGGNCGIYEGVLVREKAVVAAGTILTASTPVYDLINEKIYKSSDNKPLEIPAGAVVIPGSRRISKGWGKKAALSIQTPLIIKYRDEKTNKAVELEHLLR
jgi:2,3,4,5-tetrahydropyridine-2-carboxylate N-succinyltransferase